MIGSLQRCMMNVAKYSTSQKHIRWTSIWQSFSALNSVCFGELRAFQGDLFHLMGREILYCRNYSVGISHFWASMTIILAGPAPPWQLQNCYGCSCWHEQCSMHRSLHTARSQRVGCVGWAMCCLVCSIQLFVCFFFKGWFLMLQCLTIYITWFLASRGFFSYKR